MPEEINKNPEAGWVLTMLRWNTGAPDTNDRCSLAIFTRGQEPPTTREIKATKNTHRPILGVETGKGWLWCVHAPRANVKYVSEIVNQVARDYVDNFVIAGDFNLAPPNMDGINRAVACISSGKSTHPSTGTELDYAFVPDKTKTEWTAERLETYTESDHFPVRLDWRKSGTSSG